MSERPSKANSTLARTVRHGNRDFVYCWNTYTTCGGGDTTDSPESVTLPRSARMRPAAICNSVLLPQPDGPTTARKPPCLSSRSMPSSATVCASPEPKLLPTRLSFNSVTRDPPRVRRPDKAAELPAHAVRCQPSSTFQRAPQTEARGHREARNMPRLLLNQHLRHRHESSAAYHPCR